MKKGKVVSTVLALMMVLMVASVASAQDSEAMDIVDTAASVDDFSTLVAAVQAADLAGALKGEGPFTVFAPTNAAFEALGDQVNTLLADPSGDLTQILLYHVVPGKVMAADLADGMTATTLQGSPVTFSVSEGGAMINDSNIIQADIETSNGVIHVIDSVLIPPAEGEMGEEEMVEEEMVEEEMVEEAMDIVDTAASVDDFSTLVAAVQAADLAGALKGEGPFTVFAPTNAAFEALGDQVNTLLADPSGDLTQILLYHVVPSKVMAADVTDGMTATTLQGSPVTFSVSEGGVMINGANIIQTDIETSNGVIHVIDSVITPPAEGEMADEAMSEEEMPAPETMPVTGGVQSSIPVSLVVVGLVLAVFAGGVAYTRRSN